MPPPPQSQLLVLSAGKANATIPLRAASGYTLHPATDWPTEWCTQPCVRVIQEETTIAGVAVAAGCTVAHAPWNILWAETDTTTLWPAPPAFAGGRCIATWAPGGDGGGGYETPWAPGGGGGGVWETSTAWTETWVDQGHCITRAGWHGSWVTECSTTTAVVVPANWDDEHHHHGLNTDSTLFWFLVIILPIFGTLALALFFFSLIHKKKPKTVVTRTVRRHETRERVVEG